MKNFLKSIPKLILCLVMIIMMILFIFAFIIISSYENKSVSLSSFVDTKNIEKIIFTNDEKNAENLYVAYIYDSETNIKEFTNIVSKATARYQSKNMHEKTPGWWKKYIIIYYKNGDVTTLTFTGNGNYACTVDTGDGKNKDVLLNFYETQTFTSFVKESSQKPVLVDKNYNYVKELSPQKLDVELYFGDDYDKPWHGN